MSLKLSKYSLRIPQDVRAIYCKKKNLLTIWGPVKRKSIDLKLKIKIDKLRKTVIISPLTTFKLSNVEKKKIKTLRSTTIALVKHLFIESSIIIFQKLKLIGVGYRADLTNTFFKENILTLKLGFSHLIFINIPRNLKLNLLTKTKFCIFGNSYTKISQFSSEIRSAKKPEPYKGKGVLYEDEVITLKEGKKI